MNPVKLAAGILLCMFVPVFLAANIVHCIKTKKVVDYEHFDEFMVRFFYPAVFIAMLIFLIIKL